MQSVNVLPVFLSQDTDLKTKESSNASADSNKDTDFSSLVEQHLPEDSKTSSREESAAEQAPTAIDGKAISGNGKTEEHETNNSQKSDSDKSLNAAHTGKETPVDEIPKEGNDTDKETSMNNESLTESEQFIALLYNSDHTLASAPAAKTEIGKDTVSAKSGQVKDGNSKVIDAEVKNKDGKVEVVNAAVASAESDPVLTGEHKLKAFSKEEVLVRTQIKNGNASATQPNDQLLKDYLLSLQSQQGAIKSESITSQQLMNAQLVNAQLNNNKITDVASGVSLASKSQLTEKADSGLYQLPVEPVEPVDKRKPIVEGMSRLAKESVTKESVAKESVAKGEVMHSDEKARSLVKPQGQVDAELATKVTGEAVVSSTKITDFSPEYKSVNPSDSDAGKLELSKANTDKLKAELNPQTVVENIPQLRPMVAQEKQPVLTSAQLQALQQVQTQQKVQAVTSEQQAIEEVSEEYIDPMLFPEEQLKDQGVKIPSKMIDNIATRSVSDLQAQTVQATQTKQNNDAYLDHQVSEVLNHNVVSDTVQIQKNNIQLQQETISIFRKDFADAVKDKVMMTINQKLQQFDITLDPPEFGNMQVRVNLQGEQASVNFVVQNQQAKDALEQNMHKLRDMLSEQGVDVGDANVEQQNQQKNSDEQNLPKNNGNSDILTNAPQKDEHNVEHILSAELFDSSATSVDYYA
ncbi:hypothetical protein CXF85_20545 [Colwellia sp. 75C3]|uniref:flagellar hook-length control protein FliK n=1 Tax=Colwellia sp. 75C3 TaxID=888425 RepID=UPI000C334028|nr:flagellar hook-length control protein FliK [Colwellia sp. 75C3]PKG81145.1 hypothetical protein CXF85_20545 [Colwellia sp. 75C3]